jgi:hypothetical protein
MKVPYGQVFWACDEESVLLINIQINNLCLVLMKVVVQSIIVPHVIVTLS